MTETRETDPPLSAQAPSPLRGSRRRKRSLNDEVRDAILEELIISEAAPAGTRLPTEADLCRRYEVSRVTVRAALASLQEAGYINIRQGLGSTVLPRPETITSGISQLRSFETFAREHGLTVETADVEIETVALDDYEAAKLDVAPGTGALVIRRVKLYDGQRVGWILDYVPEGVIPFSTLTEEFAGSVLDVLLAHRDVDVDYADCELRPVALTAALARRLDVAPRTPALMFDELTRTSQGRTINWSQAWLLPDHFHFYVRRRR
jgi:DNA-binding GntR family transcriptional regulator